MTESNWRNYTAFASVPFVLVLGNSMLVPITPEMAKQMKLTKLQSSLVISIFSLTTALFIPIIGYLSDHMKRTSVIIPALAV
ncbi:MFS transporter [Paenibacillus sp. L3-i20]|uniref:MFS transporter n=1 Tax=Paenibacillus sp. L3-i20 TaxID=2905833 RepID=UPI001EE02601|nr:MFS transporter [Paenibacillus sp. L3-i20]GKU79776.1 hypothetical protein L3i20_v241730 [Paenibacillus sp. L3-i20]